MPDEMSANSRVALAEIKGDVKLILAGQERTHADVQEIRHTLDTHNRRIGQLETDRSIREGERKGLSFTGKAILAVASLLTGTGIGAAILELVK